MNSKIFGILFLGVLLGGLVGYGGAYFFYTPQINELSLQYENLSQERDDLNTAYENMSEDYENLNTDYEILEDQRDDLQDQYSTLSSQYNTLQIDCNSISANYDSTLDKLKGLSDDVQDFNELLNSYCFFEESFPRVLCSNEVEEVSSIVSLITFPSEIWVNYNTIYNYIVLNVEYVNDIGLPYITTCEYQNFDGDEVITGFSTDTREDYIQTPKFTLENEQGDCDDQAVLAYAMIGYYDKYIYGTEYELYIAFSSGSGHVAVFLPVQDGNLCIIDPSGNYLTRRSGSITSKTASIELQNYDNYWSTQGEITNIQLYQVNIVTGISTMVESGSINEIADFLES